MCESSCSAVDQAITAFLAARDQGNAAEKALEVVCANEQDFQCFVSAEHVPQCGIFVQQAEMYGFHLPRNVSALASTCGQIGSPTLLARSELFKFDASSFLGGAHEKTKLLDAAVTTSSA